MHLPATLRTIATVLACLVATLALAAVLAVRTDRIRCLRVLTGSMSPTVPAGSLVAGPRVSADRLRVGELVMFVPPAPYRTPGDHPIVHRIVRITSPHVDRYLRTKGDANPVADPWLIDANRTTLYGVRWHSLRAGEVFGATHKWGPASAAVLLVVPAWMAVMRRLVGRPAGRHRRPAASRSGGVLRMRTSS